MTARTRLFFLLLGGVFIALVATFGFFFFRDNFSTHYPIKVLSAIAFRAAEIPWWNFADGGGQSLDADQTHCLLDSLVKAGWLRKTSTQTTGRTKHRWETNPKLFTFSNAESAESAESL